MSLSIKDIARLSGVSTATVSRTLSAPEKVTRQTREQVMQVVEEHGYRVNSMARNLRRQRADSVLALVPDLGNPFFSAIFAGIQDRLSQAGVDLLVADNRSLHPSGRSVLSQLRDARADGLICLDGGFSDEARRELAASGMENRVVFACEWPMAGGFPSVRSDNREGMRLAIDYLAGLGHRCIAYCAGPAGNVLNIERRAGAQEALAAHGLTLPDSRVFEGDFSLQAGEKAAQVFVEMAERPTAVICASDQLAMGLIHGLSKHGIHAPRDVSVMGFDDIITSAYFLPALTTIRQNRLGLGVEAATVLLDLIDGKSVPRDHVVTLPVSLQIRASTAVPR
ncbi:HTH-type transcriptional repressor CytR [Aquimixticola soesokkakensis]|uniref:HTH-type transcriptional repressor CytR n=1 Tax=Aquimixticola soesokkakensis TaxID=1519096 RepID=A0A1Y5RKD2_9RHOB|nr:LacI family DNA-binding transcriptional regulator [Aquimixticola soesokkakensis]SLN19639.1 HTH-type transcriptional repressor CytR [Aquimixticola soesokkakensis]